MAVVSQRFVVSRKILEVRGCYVCVVIAEE